MFACSEPNYNLSWAVFGPLNRPPLTTHVFNLTSWWLTSRTIWNVLTYGSTNACEKYLELWIFLFHSHKLDHTVTTLQSEIWEDLNLYSWATMAHIWLQNKLYPLWNEGCIFASVFKSHPLVKSAKGSNTNVLKWHIKGKSHSVVVFVFVYLSVYGRQGLLCVVQPDLELMIPLPQPSEC